ncbi:phage major capsid protein, partial [Mesorhizobium sp. M2A.F.Ca.ET.046.02.1.1]
MRALDALEIKGDDDDGQAVVTKALNDFREAVETRLKAVETKTGDSV